jgi:hypothetical protein
MKLSLLILLLTTYCFANSFHLEIGSSATNFNKFSIPKDTSSQLNMPTSGSLTSYRLSVLYDLDEGHQLYFLFAPLETNYSLTSSGGFKFNNTNFAGSTATSVGYKFNSYRVGYLWKWQTGSLKYWLGAVGKIRDAEISVSQGSTSDSYDNIGFVPLASFGFEWFIANNISIFSHTDALGASQGSAYDSQLEVKYSFGKLGASLGKRILGGGADNEKVYNFAQFDTYYLRLSYSF